MMIMAEKLRERLRSSEGFSLPEMLVTAMIFLFLLGGIYGVLHASQESWEVNKVRIELQQELRKAMDWMAYDLRQAGDSSIVNVLADDSTYTTIIFKVPTGVSAGSLTWGANDVQFQLGGTDGDQLQRVEGGTTEILAQDIQSLEFMRSSTSPDILEVDMLAQRDTATGKTVAYQLDFEIQLRN